MDMVWVENGIQWIKSLGIFTLGTATITGIIGYLFKTVFTQMLNQQTEHYKSILNQQTEHYKAELQQINNKHQITFSKLHVDRADTIKKLYSQLINLQLSTFELLGPKGMVYEESIDRSVEKTRMIELIDKVQIESAKLHDDYKINRIYFSERICDMFDKITIHIQKATFHLRLASSYTPEETEKYMLDLENRDREVLDSILNEIPKLRDALESEFRKLLGVTEE